MLVLYHFRIKGKQQPVKTWEPQEHCLFTIIISGGQLMLISKLYKYQESSDLVPKISSHGFLKEVQDLALDEREFEQRDSCPASIGRVTNQFQGIQEANTRPSVNKLKFRRQLLLQMIMILNTFQIHDRWPREVQAEGFFRGAHCLLTENLPYKHQ